MTPADRPGDYVQAMMDSGATICRPGAPRLPGVPARRIVSPRQSGAPDRFPPAQGQAIAPAPHGIAWWIEQNGAIWLVRRPAKGMLGGMVALPGPEWSEKPPAVRPLAHVSHGFTHFTLDLHIVARADPPAKAGGSRSISSPKRGCRRSIARRSRPCSISGGPLPPDPFFSAPDSIAPTACAPIRRPSPSCTAMTRLGSSSGRMARPRSTNRADCVGSRSKDPRRCSWGSTTAIRRDFPPCPTATRPPPPMRISAAGLARRQERPRRSRPH